MNRKFGSALIPLLLASTLLPGCGSGTTFLEMNRIAGFVGNTSGKMYVEYIGGEDSTEFRDQLYKSLSEDGRFATERYGFTPPENPDSVTKAPTLILSGFYRTDRDTRRFTEGSGENGTKYKEITDIHEFQYLIRDAFTGEEIDASVASFDDVEKAEDKTVSFLDEIIDDAIGGVVDRAVGNLVRIESGHREALARIFVESLHLHQEKRRVGLLQDKDIPELEEGIQFVRNGDWPEAIAKFQAGAEGHPGSKSLHKAYFNLGVAYEYNHEFEKALTSLRLADELFPQENYAAEIDFCQWFARQYEWQKRHDFPL